MPTHTETQTYEVLNIIPAQPGTVACYLVEEDDGTVIVVTEPIMCLAHVFIPDPDADEDDEDATGATSIEGVIYPDADDSMNEVTIASDDPAYCGLAANDEHALKKWGETAKVRTERNKRVREAAAADTTTGRTQSM